MPIKENENIRRNYSDGVTESVRISLHHPPTGFIFFSHILAYLFLAFVSKYPCLKSFSLPPATAKLRVPEMTVCSL
jgi:hypothetical protein